MQIFKIFVKKNGYFFERHYFPLSDVRPAAYYESDSVDDRNALAPAACLFPSLVPDS
jgi:hypothetical protein